MRVLLPVHPLCLCFSIKKQKVLQWCGQRGLKGCDTAVAEIAAGKLICWAGMDFVLFIAGERAGERASGGDLCGRHGNHPLSATHPSGRRIPRRLERLLCALPRQPCGAKVAPPTAREQLCSSTVRRVAELSLRWRSLHAQSAPRTTRRARVLPPDTLAGVDAKRVRGRTRKHGSRPRAVLVVGVVFVNRPASRRRAKGAVGSHSVRNLHFYVFKLLAKTLHELCCQLLGNILVYLVMPLVSFHKAKYFQKPKCKN